MFTKGEWVTEGNFVGVEMEGNLYEICKVASFQPEAKENACLISAAPDMYRGLSKLVEELNDYEWYDMPAGIAVALTYAEDALIKAEGKCGQ